MKPEIDSNRASSKCAQEITPENKNGSAPANETANQLHATDAKARAASALGETLEPKKQTAPMPPVTMAAAVSPNPPPPPSIRATKTDRTIAAATARSPAPATRTGVTASRLNAKLPWSRFYANGGLSVEAAHQLPPESLEPVLSKLCLPTS